jgi:2-polyprenylphenol 6-hydroxylase
MNQRRSTDFDVIVLGAGAIGAALASLLITQRVCAAGRVALVAERFAPPLAAGADWDLRVFALSRASERLLKACGVWNSLPKSRVCGYERMCVWDASGEPDGAGSLSFDCAQIGEPNLGAIVDGAALQWHCLQSARMAGAVLIEGSIAAATAGDNDIRVQLVDGRDLRGKLLAGADGTDSKTRELLGIATAGHTYHQDALVAHVSTARPHGNTARQRFLSTGPLAFLPLTDGRCSIVWSLARPEADRLGGMEPGAFNATLTKASGGVLGDCTLTTPLAKFPLKLQYALDYVRPRAVLLGDAAHVVHPLAGQGLNLGLLDCAALVQVLYEGGADSFGDTKFLRRYERWRRSENLMAAAALDGLERLFTNSDAATVGLRTAGLNVINKLPFVKRAFAQRALGLSGDVPELLKAEPV